jgi:hypothetical protein
MRIMPTTPGVGTIDGRAMPKSTLCDACAKRPRRVWWIMDDHVACSRRCLQRLVDDTEIEIPELDSLKPDDD